MNKQFLNEFLKFTDEKTDWKENSDTTNSQVIDAFLSKYRKNNYSNEIIKILEEESFNMTSEAGDTEIVIIEDDFENIANKISDLFSSNDVSIKIFKKHESFTKIFVECKNNKITKMKEILSKEFGGEWFLVNHLKKNELIILNENNNNYSKYKLNIHENSKGN